MTEYVVRDSCSTMPYQGRQGDTLRIGTTVFTREAKRWVSTAVLDEENSIVLSLQRAVLIQNDVVDFRAYSKNPKRHAMIHHDVLLRPDALDITAAVAKAMRVVRKAARVAQTDPLFLAAREIEKCGRVPLAWAVREGSDPGWMQRAWRASENPSAMVDLAGSIPDFAPDPPWLSSSPYRLAFPNLRWRSVVKFIHEGVTFSLHDKQTANEIRARIPALPTISELLALPSK